LLVERIRAILRRNEMRAANNNDSDDHETITQGHLTLDKDRHLCLWKGGEVNLTVTEFMLVEALALRPGHVKSRDSLMDIAYGDAIYVDDRTIDSHIKRIRKKFKVVDDEFDHIDTVYGVGYKYKE
jgi:two-component system response regulator ChvI